MAFPSLERAAQDLSWGSGEEAVGRLGSWRGELARALWPAPVSFLLADLILSRLLPPPSLRMGAVLWEVVGPVQQLEEAEPGSGATSGWTGPGDRGQEDGACKPLPRGSKR